ncbi:GH25 family lysozyme [Limosilactobacillus mucosae]
MNNERQKVQAYQSTQQKTLKKWTLFSGITLTALSFGLIIHSGTAQADAATTSSSVSQSTTDITNAQSVVLTSTASSTADAANNTAVSQSASSSSESATSTANTKATSSTSDTKASTVANTDSSAQNSTTAASTTSQDSNTSNSASTTSTSTSETSKTSTNENSALATTASSTAVVANTDQEIALQTLAAYSTSADAIDVSSYQGAMSVGTYSWLKSLGVKYVIVKLTQGTTYKNQYAQTQINNAKAAGLTIATYDYAVFTDSASAIAEADHYANVASSYGLDGSTLMIADMEDNVTKRSNIAALLNEFWNELSRRGYTNHGVYASYSYDQTYNVSSTVGHSKTWIAAYYYDRWKNTILNSDYGAWQYTDSFNGYDGSIDMGMFSTYMSLNGEKQENGYWYLYKNGVRQTGFQSLSDGRTVYYNSQGQMQHGEQKINGYWYYFRTDNGAMVTGFQKLSDGRTVYYNSQGQMQYGNQTIDGNKYYLNIWTGAITYGEVEINGRNYYYNDSTGIQETGLVYNQKAKKLQYYDPATGALKTGVASVNSNNTTILLNSDGSVNTSKLTTGIQKIGGYSYYYSASQGTFLSGWQTVNGKKYYFDPTTLKMTTGQKKINGYWYDFDSSGIMQTGFTKLSDGQKTYTVYYNTEGKMLYGEQKINNKWYYFNVQNGQMAQGWFTLSDGRLVYYDVDANGNGQGMLHGMSSVNGTNYYFNIWTGARESGFKQVNGQTYYFNPQMLTGIQHIGNYWYNFGSDGIMKTGFVILSSNGHIVYYNASGQLQYGEKQINGKWYHFDTTDGHAAQGWYTLEDGRIVYYDVDSQGNGQGMLHGIQTVNDKKYAFDQWTGALKKNYEVKINGYWYYFGSDGSMQTGFVTLTDTGNKRLVYYNAEGQMQYGWQTINGKKYYFNVWTGAAYQGEYKIDGKWYYFGSDGSMQTGFVTLTDTGDKRIVYYNSEGQMQYGWQTISGKKYYFNVWTGAMYQGEHKIDGKWYYFGSNGIMQTGFVTLSDGRVVYYNAQGQMLYGWQTINGTKYYFNVWTGNKEK